MGKYEEAKNAIEKKGKTEMAVDPKSVPVLEPISMSEFAEAIAAGGEMAPSFVEMKEGEQFRAYFMDRLDGVIEQIEDGKAVVKPVKRLVFELANKDRVGLGIMFSMLEVTQLTQKIGEALPADGSCFVLVGKGGKKQTGKKRQMDVFEVVSFRNARKPRRGNLMLDEKSGQSE